MDQRGAAGKLEHAQGAVLKDRRTTPDRRGLQVNRIIKAGALQTVMGFPDSSIGAVVSDPPFFTGVGRDDGGFGKDPWEDINSVQAAGVWATAIMEQLKRTVRRGGAIALMCGCHASAAWMIAAENAGLQWMAEIDILWNTGKPRQRNFGGLMTHVLWFVRPGAKHTWNSNRKAFYSNVIVCKKVPIAHRLHISQKPIELTNFLVSLLARPDDVVLDPFCGSGSTLVSASLAGRPWIGIDKDPRNVISARERMKHPELEEENEIFFWVNGRLEPI